MLRPPPTSTLFPYTTLFRSVAIGGQARGGLRIHDAFAKRREIFFGNVGAGAVEQAIPFGAHGLHVDAVIGESAVEIAGAAPVERVHDQGWLGLAQRVELNELFETPQIVLAQIDVFAMRRVFCTVRKRRNTTIRGK